MADEVDGVKKATAITHEVQEAVGFSEYGQLVLTKVDIEAGEFVLRRPVSPRAALGQACPE